jgi:RNA polymerase sigma factor (sigma-70 family)
MAEDAMQETWIAALRSPPRLDRPLAPWLRSVLHNRVINHLRGDRRRRAREKEAIRPSVGASPEELVERLQTQKLLVDRVCALPAPYRQIVVLRYFEGLSSSEIAAQLNLPAPTVRGRLRTALAELRESLERASGGRRAWMVAAESLAGRRPPAGAPGLRAPAAATGPILGGAIALLVLGGLVGMISPGRGRVAPEPASAPGALSVREPVARQSVSPGQALVPTPEGDSFAAPASDQVEAVPATTVAKEGARPPAAPAGLAISGTVRFLGHLPPGEVVDRPGDPFCSRFPAPHRRELAVDRYGGLGGAVVRVAAGWEGRALPPSEPLTFRQRRCQYQPGMQVAQLGQIIALHNEDEVVHEVQAWVGDTPVLARAQAFRGPALELRADWAGQVVRLGCKAHPITSAHVLVSETPFHDVTAEDGRFRLEGLPAGRYQLEAWHPRLGARRLEVSVPSGREVLLELGEVSRPAMVIGPGRCAIAVEGDSPVAQACRREGRRGAKKVMKGMVAQAKKRGQRLECDSCHRNDQDWALQGEARRRFEALLSASGISGTGTRGFRGGGGP